MVQWIKCLLAMQGFFSPIRQGVIGKMELGVKDVALLHFLVG